MSEEQYEESATLYALDLLEGEEKTQFETRLARDAGLQRMVLELRESAAALANLSAATPPAELRERVLRAISAEGVRRPTANSNLVALRTFLPWAMAAGFALLGLWLAQRGATTRAELALSRTEAQIADLGLKSVRSLLEAERIVNQKQILDLTTEVADGQQGPDLASLKIATLASMPGNSTDALAVAVWNPEKQEGVLTLERVPAPAADQNYELWVIEAKPDAKPISAGVFVAAADGTGRVQFKPTAPVGALAKFAVSRERKDGATSHAAPSEVVMISR